MYSTCILNVSYADEVESLDAASVREGRRLEEHDAGIERRVHVGADHNVGEGRVCVRVRGSGALGPGGGVLIYTS